MNYQITLDRCTINASSQQELDMILRKISYNPKDLKMNCSLEGHEHDESFQPKHSKTSNECYAALRKDREEKCVTKCSAYPMSVVEAYRRGHIFSHDDFIF